MPIRKVVATIMNEIYMFMCVSVCVCVDITIDEFDVNVVS